MFSGSAWMTIRNRSVSIDPLVDSTGYYVKEQGLVTHRMRTYPATDGGCHRFLKDSIRPVDLSPRK